MTVKESEIADKLREIFPGPVPEFVTRQQVAKLLTAAGYPISGQHLAALAMKANGGKRGPPIAGRWGPRVLYRPDEALAWTQAQIRPITDPVRSTVQREIAA